MWTLDEIEARWLGDGSLTGSTEEIVAAFNRVERWFGREWMETSRRTPVGGEVTGLGPVLHMLTKGERLAALEGVPNNGKLADRLRRNDPDAWSELTAIFLVMHEDPALVIELEPSILINGHERHPDFRVARDGGPWTYVEVTEPRDSEAALRLYDLMARLTAMPEVGRESYALEIFLRRDPSEAEVELLRRRVDDVLTLTGQHEEDLADGLGKLFLNHSPPGLIELDDHGEPHRPRLGRSAVHVDGGVPVRHIVTRIAHSDVRLEKVLRDEAEQLSRDTPNLIMLAASGTSRWREWPDQVQQRLRHIHTRIGGVCLFERAFIPEDGRLRWQVETKMVVNQRAAIPLPDWLVTKLS